MDTLQLPAPAKINRFLHITGQREDGYHTLQTLFQFLDLADNLTFEPRHDRKIVFDSNCRGILKNNLVVKAAKMLQQITSCDKGMDIYLDKKIPIGGGLGGGSSDAATALVALNHLWHLKLPKTQLMQIGLEMGADIPVFIHGHSCWAEGIGEQLTDLEPPESWAVVLAPPVSVSTAEIFFDKALSRDTSACRISTSLIDSGHNDCEPIVRQRYPEVANAIDWLNEFAPARMTGTGGCIFAIVAEQQTAQDIVSKMPKNYQGFVVQVLNHSPLYDAMEVGK